MDKLPSNAEPRKPGLQFHPIANSLPLTEGEEFEQLVADIRVQGLLEPIVLHEDMILDGRNRYLACAKAGVDPTFTPFRGDDPLAYVVSANIIRRHLKLTIEQRRELISKLLEAHPEK